MTDQDRRVALVTGGGSGIGEAAVRAFLAADMAVVIADITPDTGDLAKDLCALGHAAVFVHTDVASSQACAAAVATCLDRFGRLDVAFNNVGITDPLSTDEAILSVDAWDRVMSISLSGMFYSVRAELAAMLPQGGGVIVNMASVAGLVSLQGQIAYVASKHGVVGLTKAICDAYADRNIRCNAIAAGLVDSPGLRRVRDGGGGAAINAFVDRIPMRSVSTVEQIAQAVLWLASDAAAYVNGVTLPVDGGYLTR